MANLLCRGLNLLGRSVAEPGAAARLQSALTVLEQRFQLPAEAGFAATGGRFYAARLGADTLILDLQESRFCLWPDASPREFEFRTQQGQAQTVLMVEGDGSRYHPYAPWSDLDWLVLDDWPPEQWTPLSTGAL